MPLSEHEQRLLDQIERALYAEDPKFASAVRTTDLRSHLLRRLKRSAALLGAGLVLLVVGVAMQMLALGVAGFLVMLGACLVIMRSLARLRGENNAFTPRTRKPRRADGGGGGRADGGGGGGGGDKTSWLGRIEERWHRRWDDRDR